MKTQKLILTVLSMLIFVHLNLANNGVANVGKTVNSLHVSIDGRQELISIIQYLGGYFRLNNLNTDYKTDVDSYFSGYKNHETVLFVQKLTKQRFTYDAPPSAMLYFSNSFEVEIEFTEYIVNRAGGKANISEFARLIKKFAEDTKFNKFFKAHLEFYSQVVDEFTSKLSDFHEIETIEMFYGKKQNSYNIILSILNAGNYGPSVVSNGKVDIYNIMSPKKENNGSPSYGDVKNIEYIVWHEFGHSFVNSLTTDHIGLISKYETLKEPIKEPMKKQAYDKWETIVNEHIIRAVTIKLVEEKYGAEAADKAKFKEISRSFYYIEPLCEQLDNYIKSRNKYKSFSDFYPYLVENAFNKALTIDYHNRYLKNLNKTFRDIDFIVVSEDEGNGEIQKEISGYVNGIKNKFFKNVPLITDEEAMKLELSKYSFLIYGTIENNLLLQKFKSNLPIQISDSIIYADKEYVESNAKAIFNMPNPFNQEKYIVVYTAQKPEGIIYINNVYHGPTNYIVFKNRKNVLKDGFVVKENDKWVCK